MERQCRNGNGDGGRFDLFSFLQLSGVMVVDVSAN